MRLLTAEEYKRMYFREIASHYGMKESDFIEEVYPAEKIIWQTNGLYNSYVEWHKRTQNKLAKALK